MIRPSASLAGLVLAWVALAAGTWTRVDEAKVTFAARGTAGFKLAGTTDQLSVRDDGANLTFTVPLKTVKTGIDLRDRHMNEKYLETQKFPDATLVLPRAALKVPARDGETTQGEVTGTLTLHGVTRDQTVRYTAQRVGGAQRVSASFKMNFRDHGVNVPSYLGVTVKPDVEVQAAFRLQE